MTVAVPLAHPNGATHRLMIADALNKVQTGKLNCTIGVLLAANAASTVVTDARISGDTAPILTPVTADSAAEVAAGSFYVTTANGAATINHRNTANTNRYFILALLG